MAEETKETYEKAIEIAKEHVENALHAYSETDSFTVEVGSLRMADRYMGKAYCLASQLGDKDLLTSLGELSEELDDNWKDFFFRWGDDEE